MPIILSSSLAAAPSALSWGWDETLDLGTDGDFFVDQSTGSDANAGTTEGAAFATIQAGVNAAELADGGKIRVKGAKYRETVTILGGSSNVSRVELLSYGTQRPIITGGDQLTGWEECTVADEAVVGPNYASIWKRTGVANTTFPNDNPASANIFENNIQMVLCVGWTGGDLADKFFHDNLPDGYNADDVTTASGDILSYEDASVTSAFTTAQIENAQLIGMRTPNISFTSAISGVSGSTITITDQTNPYESNADKDKFILVNLLPTIEQGQWGYVNNGTTSDLYIWPTDAANVTSNIDVCARHRCIVFSNSEFITIKGFVMQQIAGRGTPTDGLEALILQDAGQIGQHITIENNRLYGTSFDTTRNRAAIRVLGVSDLVVKNNTIESVQFGWGLQLFGSGATTAPFSDTVFAERGLMARNLVKRTGRTPIWITGWRVFVMAHNRIMETGFGAHANKTNLYQQMHEILVWGNSYVNSDGYFTPQRASKFYLFFNHVTATRSAGANTGRAFVDQQGLSPPSEWLPDSGDSFLINNTFWTQPIAYDGTATNGVKIGSPIAPSVTYTLKNNYMHGLLVKHPTDGDVTDVVDLSSNNWNSASDGAFTANDVAMNGAVNFTDPSAGDFTLLPGAPIRSEMGDDISADITAMQSLFGSLFSDWTLDALGNTITHTAPRIGAVVDYDYSTLRGDAAFQILTPA